MINQIPPPYGETQGQPNPAGVGYNQGQSQGQMYYTNGCTQMVYACAPASTTYSNYRSKQSIGIGICSIVIGVLCIAFNSTLIGLVSTNSYEYYEDAIFSVVSYGIWGGVFFIIAGGLGIGAGSSKSKCQIVGFMVLAIISTTVAAAVFSLGILGCVTSYNPDTLAMNILITILSAIEGGLMIWGSILCCGVACCGATNTTYVTPTSPVQIVPVNGNQQVYLVSGGPGSMPQYVPYPAGYPMQGTVAAPTYPVVSLGYNGDVKHAGNHP